MKPILVLKGKAENVFREFDCYVRAFGDKTLDELMPAYNPDDPRRIKREHPDGTSD